MSINYSISSSINKKNEKVIENLKKGGKKIFSNSFNQFILISLK